MPSTLPASDCRVNSLTAAATPQQPQVPWDLSSSAEHADIVAEQHTEVAAFARSPSPALDSPSSHHGSPDRHVDQAESGQGQNASRAAGQETVSSTAGPGALESSLQNNADLLASSKQLRATRDHASKQHKVGLCHCQLLSGTNMHMLLQKQQPQGPAVQGCNIRL